MPDPFDEYRRIDSIIPSCFNCVNCISCGCKFEKVENDDPKPKEEEASPLLSPPKQSYKCQEQKCSKVFMEENQFLTHVKKHDTLYECGFDNCEQTFKIVRSSLCRNLI